MKIKHNWKEKPAFSFDKKTTKQITHPKWEGKLQQREEEKIVVCILFLKIYSAL